MESERLAGPEQFFGLGIQEILFSDGLTQQEASANVTFFYIHDYNSKIESIDQQYPNSVTYNGHDIPGGLSMAVVIDGSEIFYIFDLEQRTG